MSETDNVICLYIMLWMTFSSDINVKSRHMILIQFPGFTVNAIRVTAPKEKDSVLWANNQENIPI